MPGRAPRLEGTQQAQCPPHEAPVEGAATGGRSIRPGEHLEGAPTVGSGVGRAEMLLIESDLRDGRHSRGRERRGGPGLLQKRKHRVWQEGL